MGTIPDMATIAGRKAACRLPLRPFEPHHRRVYVDGDRDVQSQLVPAQGLWVALAIWHLTTWTRDPCYRHFRRRRGS